MIESKLKNYFCPACSTSLKLDLDELGKNTRFYCPRCRRVLARSSSRNFLRIMAALILASGLFAVYTHAIDFRDLPRIASGGLVLCFSLSVFIYSWIVPELRRSSPQEQQGYEYLRYRDLQARQAKALEEPAFEESEDQSLEANS